MSAIREYLVKNNLLNSAGQPSLGRLSGKILCEIIDRVQEHREAVERKRRKDSRKARENGFAKPTPEEVTAFGLSIGFPIDGEEFCAHYESNGWKVGNTRMISWHAAVQTWKKNQPKFGGVAMLPRPPQRKLGEGKQTDPYLVPTFDHCQVIARTWPRDNYPDRDPWEEKPWHEIPLTVRLEILKHQP